MSKSALPKSSDRNPILKKTQEQKMARSAHAYVRGSTAQFYEWLSTPTATNLPQGPAVWICGDCHLGNIGPVANAEGEVELEIRDLDQTVIGNPVHDLVRLGLSLATAARGSDLPGVTTARMIEQMIGGYQDALKRGKQRKQEKGTLPSPIEEVLKSAVHRRWKHLAEERIEDVKPQIPLGKRFWKLTKEEKLAIEVLFKTEPVRKLITSLQGRKDSASIEVIDAAYWVKGCSSLGRLRYAVLLQVGKTRGSKTAYCLVDIKEAVPAAAPRIKSSQRFSDHAARVVEGAVKLSPYLGERMLSATLLGKPVVIRELLPQDLKLELETLTVDDAVAAARHLAFVVGRAHARQMDTATRREWNSTLNLRRPKPLNAPSWLWSSIVELIAKHETAYLEHCRVYALAV